MGLYNIKNERVVLSAGQCLFSTGNIHPDRIMAEHDLFYILEGSWEIWQNNSRYMLFPGDVIVLHANQHHFGLLPCEPRTRTIFIHVKNDPDDYFQEDIPTSNHVLLNTVIHCQFNDDIKKYFKIIVQLFESENFLKEERISCVLRLLLIGLDDCKMNSGHNRLIQKALMIMQNNPDKIFKSEEMAAQLYVSARTFRNKFKEVFHKSFTQYQMEVKLEKVCLILKTYPEMRTKEIAANFGFYDEFHLSKVFKRHYGVSPSQYRKESIELSQQDSRKHPLS